MNEWLWNVLPNVMPRLDELWQATVDTIIMVLWSGVISFVIGIVIGVLLIVTRPSGILASPRWHNVLDKTINVLRSIPFIVLLTAAMPLSRLIMGTSIGLTGAIVPLIIGTVPFLARQVESALAAVDGGLVEAAVAMGASPREIITRVYLREGIPGIARNTTITAIALINLTAMAGVVGAGGLGDFAIRYGHDRNFQDVTWVTIFVLVIMVSIIQFIGDRIVKANTH